MTIIIRKESPVKDVTFGEAMSFSLDNYYEILKAKAGQLSAGEFLQLKAVADTIDLSSDIKASEGGYIWFSYYNLLNRSDRAIEPAPVSGEVSTSAVSLVNVYTRFMLKLRKYVILSNVSPEDQKRIALLDDEITMHGNDINKYYVQDRKNWKDYAEAMGYEYGDNQAYLQWVQYSGNLKKIDELISLIQIKDFERRSILSKQKYSNPDDEEIIKADFALTSPSSRLRYPLYPDNMYDEGDKFSVVYQAKLGLGSTALFEDRHAISWNLTLNTIKTSNDGAFTGNFNKQTQQSSAISTDWSSSASASYGLFSIRGSASGSEKITEEFKKGKNITVASKAAFRIGINTPVWFNADLFNHRYVRENPKDFEEFFGDKGSLKYYPVGIIVIRGISIEFESTQDWAYDYNKTFGASGGGGFGAFGIRFGGSASYNSNVKEHKIDQSKTKLTFSDDVATIRFVGYVVARADHAYLEGIQGISSRLSK